MLLAASEISHESSARETGHVPNSALEPFNKISLGSARTTSRQIITKPTVAPDKAGDVPVSRQRDGKLSTAILGIAVATK